MSSSQYAYQSSDRLRVEPSKPITIKHSKDHLCWEHQEDLEEREKRFYECATWRMYNRIVDHRILSPTLQGAAPIHHHTQLQQCRSSPHVHKINRSYHSPEQSQQSELVRPKPRYPRVVPVVTPIYEQAQHRHDFVHDATMDDETFELEL